jgi:hypothetical protein
MRVRTRRGDCVGESRTAGDSFNIGARKSSERTLRHERALEYLLSPGDPALYHDQEAMADALRAIANTERRRG